MAIIDLTIPGSQFDNTTITVQSGDVVNIPAGMMGSITINGGPDVTINILGDPDPGSTFGQLTLGGFGSDIEPTVNIPAGVDFSRYNIDANGENLTLNVGDGATLSSIDATGMSNTGTLTINAGNDVTIDGSINNYGADADFTFGSGATVTGTTTATSVGDADVTFGDNATFGGTVALSDGGNTANVNATFGDGLDVIGQITAGNDGAEMNIAIGNDATISNALNLTGQAPTNLTIGDNVTLLGNINLASSDDTVVIGDNWDLANINMGLGDDNLTIGEQAAGSGNTNIDGGSPQGVDTDGITITARADQVASFIADGWIDNGDGTFSSPPAAFNGSPINGPGIAINDFEGAAAPLPVAPNMIVDGENFAELMTPDYSDDNTPTDSGGDIIDGADGDNDVILGNGGNDTIDAGMGADEVYGGSGDDSIQGGAGNDTIEGDFATNVSDVVVDSSTVAGSDTIEGGSGDDVISGGGGSDTIYGDSGAIAGANDGSGQLTVTLESQAGGFNGSFIVEITSADGSVTTQTLTTSYDGSIGQTYNIALSAGDVVRTAFTADGVTYWSTNGSAIQTDTDGLGSNAIRLRNEDDGGSDFDDLIYTVSITGDTAYLAPNAEVVSDGGLVQLIDNGDFSNGLTNWTVLNTSGGQAPTTAATANGQLTINSNDEAAAGDGVEQSITTVGGGTYTFSADIDTNGSTHATHTVLVEAIDSSGNVIASDIQTVSTGESAQLLSMSFEAVGSSTTIRITNPTSTRSDGTDVVVDNVSVIGVLAPASGNDGADTISGDDGADVIYGEGGNDSITGDAGEDQLFGGAGGDTIEGGANNDTIYGDGDGSLSGGTRESFNWETVTDAQIDGTFTQDTGSVAVTYTRLASTGTQDANPSSDTINTSGIQGDGNTIDNNSSLVSDVNGIDASSSFRWSFS